MSDETTVVRVWFDTRSGLQHHTHRNVKGTYRQEPYFVVEFEDDYDGARMRTMEYDTDAYVAHKTITTDTDEIDGVPIDEL